MTADFAPAPSGAGAGPSMLSPELAAFEVGNRVEAFDLKGAAELNGKIGTVTGHKPPERVMVDFGPPSGAKALKPANLEVVSKS